MNLPVAVLDDDEDLAMAVARLLGRHGYAAQAFTTPAALLGAVTQGPLGCVVSDIQLGETNGFAAASTIWKNRLTRRGLLRPSPRGWRA